MGIELPSQRDASSEQALDVTPDVTSFDVAALISELSPPARYEPTPEERAERLERRYQALMRIVENLERYSSVLRLSIEELNQRNQQLEEENARLQATVEDLSERVAIDHLTGLGSLAALDARRAELQAALLGQGDRRRDQESPVAVMIVSTDIIGLKAANAISQFEGDQLLKNVAENLLALFRREDVFRRGGDEFVALLPMRNENDFAALLEKAQQFAFSDQGERVRVGYSVAYGNSASHDLVDIEKRADPKTHPENRIYRPRKLG